MTTLKQRKKLRGQYNIETGDKWNVWMQLYVQWLEDKLIKLQSQPSTTTPSDDVAAGHGAC